MNTKHHRNPPDDDQTEIGGPALPGQGDPFDGTPESKREFYVTRDAVDAALRNDWLPIEEAPKDRIIEGRFSSDEEVGRPIRWRNSRRRVGHKWVEGGVWHAAETAGAVQLHPIEWREWEPAGLHFAIGETLEEPA